MNASNQDIVERLRAAGNIPTAIRAYLARAVVLEAADEIERLRLDVSAEFFDARRNAFAATETRTDDEPCGKTLIAEAMEKCGWLERRLSDSRNEQDALRAERDAARREVCEMFIQIGGIYVRRGNQTVAASDPREIAAMRNWDCFRSASRIGNETGESAQ